MGPGSNCALDKVRIFPEFSHFINTPISLYIAICLYVYIYMTLFSFSKIKIAAPIQGRFSAAFTGAAAGAVPSFNVKDMQHEGKGLSPRSL